jgi:hypothetical protein
MISPLPPSRPVVARRTERFVLLPKVPLRPGVAATPPVYRPAALAQQKAAGNVGMQLAGIGFGAAKQSSAAPPVYRPLASTIHRAGAAGTISRPPMPYQPPAPARQVAPAVYTPAAASLVQTKLAPPIYQPGQRSTLIQRTQAAPPVYRPDGGSFVSAKQVRGSAPQHWNLGRTPQGGGTTGHGTAPPAMPQEQVMQCLKKHAEQYINSHELTDKTGRLLKPTKKIVAEYVKNKQNPEEHRNGLRTAWNNPGRQNTNAYAKKRKRTNGNAFDMPEDLIPTSTSLKKIETFDGYDSDTDNKLDLTKFMLERPKVTLKRTSGKGKTLTAPVLGVRDAIRVGRQFAKRKGCKTAPPFVAQIGSVHIEFASPGTEDIYAYPLTAMEEEGEDEASDDIAGPPAKRFKRDGGMSEFSYSGLVNNLSEQFKTPQEQHEAVSGVFSFLKSDCDAEFKPSQSELAAAIMCDGMKGVAGMLHYVGKAKSSMPQVASSFSLQHMFTIEKPGYRPAMTNGRSKATRRTEKIKKAYDK